MRLLQDGCAREEVATQREGLQMHTQGLSRKMQYPIVFSEGSWILHYFPSEDLELWQENLLMLLLFKYSCNMETVCGVVPVYK